MNQGVQNHPSSFIVESDGGSDPMTQVRCGAAALLLLPAAILGAAAAQAPPPPLPALGPAPLLFVRFAGPTGMRAAFFEGRPTPHSFDAPVVVGLRPGYVYRVQLSGFPGHPEVSLYPTVEVRGSLFRMKRMDPSAYPAPVVLSEEDVRAAIGGSMVTKVIYLENPEKAAPSETRPDAPPESDLTPGHDPLDEARDRGRPVLVVRFGERVPPPEELARGSFPGTILMPGDKSLPLPRVAPILPWISWPWYDPVLGPPDPEGECFHDGGDRGPKAAIGPGGRLVGVDPEDTVAEYTDAAGQRRVVCSNRVCICSPRYGVVRCECGVEGYESSRGVVGERVVHGQLQMERRTPSLLFRQAEELKAIQGRERAGGTQMVQGPGSLRCLKVIEATEIVGGPIELLKRAGVQSLTESEKLKLVKQIEFAKGMTGSTGLGGVEQVEGTAAIARVKGGTQTVTSTLETRELTFCCQEPRPLPPEKPLVLVKCADRDAVQPGEVVTFVLRYTNHGDRPLTDVAVTDSLATRLEYVAGSEQSDREAVFATQQNEAGSLILRWEIAGTLFPGQSGVVKFQAKVR
jgi:uncharacterized repeat protein (TIGR01451 family)